jgi:phosphatidylglycerophosphate synthase
VIDARPRGPAGPLAAERVLGRCVLAHVLDVAAQLAGEPIVVHARPEEHHRLQELVAEWPAGRVVFAPGPPSEGATILSTDRLYDPSRLRRAISCGRAPDAAVIWRLDRPKGLAGAEAELVRRQAYQPLGRYWALGPARLLARALCPTAVHPNALTLTAGALMLGGSTVVAFAPMSTLARATTAALLALALVLDTADGHLARLQGTASEFGRWLDALLDELCDMGLHAAVAWAAFVRDGAPLWLVIGMAYGMGKYLFVVGNQSWAAQGTQPIEAPAPRPLAPPEAAPRAWLRWLGHADIRWHLWIVLAVLGRLEVALIAYAVYFPMRTLGGLIRKRKAAFHV